MADSSYERIGRHSTCRVFLPLQVRWAQYFEARAYEVLGDTAAAVSRYEALVEAMGEGLARLPTLADVPARLEALTESVPTDSSRVTDTP